MIQESIAFILLALSIASHAQTSEEIKYFTISKMKLEEFPDKSPLLSEAKEVHFQKQLPVGDLVGTISELDEVSLALDKIINIGQKIWTIVEKGQPVVSLQTNSASAMPQGVLAWNQLSGWQPSQSKTYRITYKNVYGLDVVDFSYRLIFTYGGSVKGIGRFVSGATIIPAHVSVAWGFTFNSSVAIPTVVNIGSEQNPIGGIQMNVNWQISNILMNKQQTSSFFVDGLGRIKNLN